MDVRRIADPSSFLTAAGALLLGEEARHNLMLGIAGTLERHSNAYPESHFWVVEDAGRVVAAALQTPPFNLLVSQPESGGSLGALAAGLHAAARELPGVTGAVPEADEFSDAWKALSGRIVRPRMRQRIYRLTTVRPVSGVAGAARTATTEDRAVLVRWVRAFAEESFGEPPLRSPEQMVDARLRDRIGGFVLWEDGGPVSLAGWGGETPNGVRISPVYTPPEHRRRGYASALTAAVSSDQLTTGRRFCFLYTDLANPTSNRIYLNIGYEPVCDSVEYAFERARGDRS